MEDNRGATDFAIAPANTPPPPLVSLTSFTPSSRRLSSSFCEPSRPISSSRRLSWVSLEGRLVGASEATSAKTIGGVLCLEESAAWELFTPMQRVLIVAIVAVAAADAKKSRQIMNLQRSVEVRDEILASMQQKLDHLCEQVNTMKDGPECGPESLLPLYFGRDGGIWDGAQLYEPYRPSIDLEREFFDQDMAYRMSCSSLNVTEQEERRMSGLSWCSSVTSSAEIQLSTIAMEHDIYNLQKDCQEKDATIKELIAIAEASEKATSKRIADLEDIIKRKNTIITRMKKDMAVLEQKVQQLTRLRRPSFSASNSDNMTIPSMATNILYDMDSSTSPSSSDSDSPGNCGGQGPKATSTCDIDDVSCCTRNLSIEYQDNISETRNGVPSSNDLDAIENAKKGRVCPLKERPTNRIANATITSRPKQMVPCSEDPNRQRKRNVPSSKEIPPRKRWS